MIKKFKGVSPVISNTALVFENTTIIGDVVIGEDVSIWPYVTIRGDMSYVRIGNNTNIQESSVLHTNTDMPTIIGNDVTVGHNAIVHACTVGNNCLIGMGSILLDNCVVEDGAVVAAGCVVPPGKTVPKNSLAVGNPMKVIKELTTEERKPFDENTKCYLELAKQYKEEM